MPLVYANLQLCKPMGVDLPDDIENWFQNELVGNIVRTRKVEKRLQEILGYFARKRIDVMLIKGVALDLVVYEHPWYTYSADTDLVLRIDRSALSNRERQEILDELHGADFEHDFFSHHDVTMNDTLPVDFDLIWQDSWTITVGDEKAYVMSPEDMLIALCINSCRKRFVRLKSLCDIATTVHQSEELDWKLLLHKADAYDCRTIVYAALHIAEQTVGCTLPDGILDALQPNQIRSKAIAELSRRLSPVSLPLEGSAQTMGRSAHWSLLLPYVTFEPYQITRRLKHIMQNPSS